MYCHDYFVLRMAALDGKIWFCVCYHGFNGELRTESKHKRKKDAEYSLMQIKKKVSNF